MPQHDSKQSEKEYLRRTAAGAWEQFKPFSPPGMDTLADSAHLIQDFAVAIRHLPPRTSDLILDLGAGACWCSDWLQRLNCQTVAVDISHDMLRLGRSRLPRPEAARLVTGDLEDLPFATGTFDKAYCLSAIHHVPNIRKALGEVSRVLTADGAALFSEPGLGHADTPGSVTAMQDFGVLEQDIVASDFLDACSAAGFSDVQLKPMSYVISDFGLSREQWHTWRTLSRSKRPVRALQTIWRGVQEFFGLGKTSTLFEETLAMTLVRRLEGAMNDHPVIVARKSAAPARDAAAHAARVILVAAPAEALPRDPFTVSVRLENAGQVPWAGQEGRDGVFVRLGVQLLDKDQRLIDRDFHRQPIGEPLAPGEARTLTFSCPGVAEVGLFHLKFDVVVEGVAWLEPQGSLAATHAIRLT